MNNLTIGFLLPRSSLYPFLGRDIVNGFKSGAKHNGLEYSRLVFENIGFGGNSQDIYAKAEKLILQEEVKLIIAFIDYMEAVKLENLCAGNNCTLLILDPGGQIPEIVSVSPYRYTFSLQSSYCSWLTGKASVKYKKDKVLFCTSFYEGGYLQNHAFHKGVQTSGGEIVKYFFIPYEPTEFSEESFRENFETLRPETVLANFSAEAGEIFLKAFSNLEPENRTSLYVSPFMLEESWLEGLDSELDTMTGHVTWFRDLTHEENQNFLNAIKSDFQMNATIFSVLGWEAAQFTSQNFLSFLNSTTNDDKKLINTEFKGPRGEMILNSDHFFISPAYQITAKKKKDSLEINYICEFPATHDNFEIFKSDRPQGTVSKWSNTYLCI